MANDLAAHKIAAPAAPRHIAGALARASKATGAGFEFLEKMAARESSFNPAAKAKTSSAAGLFQFIEQTWLGAVKQYGAAHGLGDAADDIVRGPDGRFTVSDKARRAEILNLRFDADASAALAGELANENKSYLERRLGRAIKNADLYTAHFLGPAGAAKLLSAGASTPAADLLPKAAAANRPVFFDGARAKSVGEVVASIARSMGNADIPRIAPEAAPLTAAAPATAPDLRARAIITQERNNISASPPSRIEEALPASNFTPASQSSYRSPSAASLFFEGASSSRLSAMALNILQSLDHVRTPLQHSDKDKRF